MTPNQPPRASGPVASLRISPPRPPRSGDHKTKTAAYSDHDGAVISCYVPAAEWPGWTDSFFVTLASGNGG